MWHTFKHFIHMQYFLLPTNLVIIFVHWVSTVVCCTNPDNVHCFGLYSRTYTLFLPQSVPPAWCIFNPTNTEVAQLPTKSTTWRRAMDSAGIHPNGEQPNTALWLWVREITWNLYTGGVHGRIKAKQRWFKVTRELCHEWFHHFWHHVHDGHWTGEFATAIWCLHCFTVSFHGDVRRIRPQITRLSQLENSAMGTWPIYKNSIIPDWFEKWFDIKFWYRC